MSTTTPEQETDLESYECARNSCSTEVREDNLIEDTFCSWACRHRERGANLLKDIRHDHRFCAACFRKKKDIEKPPASAPSVVVGFEYLTPNADYDSSERVVHEHQNHHAYPADRVVTGAAVCQCGTVDHRDEWIREEHIGSLSDAAERLIGILERQAREGQHEFEVDALELAKTLRRTAEDEGSPDWELAVGRAIIDDE